MVKDLPTMWETRVQSLGREDLLEKEMAIHSSTLAWKTHGQRNLVGYNPWGRKESDTTERLHFLFIKMWALNLPDHIDFYSFKTFYFQFFSHYLCTYI